MAKKLFKPRKWLRPQYFVALGIVCAAVAILALRANNQHMVALRTALYKADQQGSGVQFALQQLQAYVTAHMNTELASGPNAVYPPIQLKYTYDRLVQAQGDSLQKQNGKLYTEAQHYCEQQDPVDFSGHNRVPCIEQYVQNHGEQVPTIPDSLYKFDFVSPRWSPDLAGWSLLASVICFAVAIAMAGRRLWHRHFASQRNK